MDDEPVAPAAPCLGGNGHIGGHRPGQDAPERSRGPVAQHRSAAKGEYGRHPSGLPCPWNVADRVDAPVA